MKPTHTKSAVVALVVALLAVCAEMSTVIEADRKVKRTRVEPQFRRLYATFGKNSTTGIEVLSGPTAIKMRNHGLPGRQWIATCGRFRFKLTIQDGVELEVEQLVERLQKLPMPYIRACEVVSDEKEDGIAVYADLGGAGAHGGKQYINMLRGVKAIIIAHEMGHTLEQKARELDPTILEQWKEAIKADKISVSRQASPTQAGHASEVDPPPSGGRRRRSGSLEARPALTGVGGAHHRLGRYRRADLP